MASSINASLSAGVVTTADTSGVLNIQTAGTTAISIDASQAVSFTNAPTVTGGTANGVAYLNGSKVLTTGSALTFSGSALAVTGSISSTGGFTSNTTITAQLDGSDSAGAGPGFNLFNTAFSRGWRTQLSASNNKVDYYFNGSAYAAATTIDTAGNFGLGVTPPTSSSGSYIWNRGGCSLSDGLGQAYYVGVQNAVYNSAWKYVANGFAGSYFIGSGQHVWNYAASGTAGGTISFTQAMMLDGGNLLVGTTSNSSSARCVIYGGTFQMDVYNASGQRQFLVGSGVISGTASGADAIIYMNKASGTSRSINCAGTINASGADYAEYMTKAGDFTVAKGDVVGIDENGKLTNVFDNAVSFMVKSTAPSYVGGDVWGTPEALGLSVPEKPSQRQATEEAEAETDKEFAVRQAQYETDKPAFDAALEAARQRVDRIAFAGQVPVNVPGATAGQYIIPVNDNGAIKGEAVSNPTFEQYQIAVGKVIAIESDGRAKIIVKVA